MTLTGKYYGFIPPSGEYGAEWPQHFVLPQGLSGLLSSAGWTRDYIADPFNLNAPSSNFGNEGFVQQTFLGASIRDFNISAGFGDSSSTLSLNLVNDEYNKSDGFGLGGGDDPYHNGQQDTFRPPVVGTPVFFKFGKNPATIEQAYRQTFDDLYKVDTLAKFQRSPTNIWGYQFPITGATRPKDEEGNIDKFPPENFSELQPYFLYDSITETIEDRSSLWDIRSPFRGRNHFVFGGILQSYTQNKSSSGKPLYPVNVKDPREILSNVQVLLNNYQGTTFNNKNIINLYGFLEYDPSPELLKDLESKKKMAGIVKKQVSKNGYVSYNGRVANWDPVTGWETSDIPADIDTDGHTWNSQDGESEVEIKPASVNLKDQYLFAKQPYSSSSNNPPEFFPITGQGFSRRSDLGMPWYRVSQGLAAIFEQYGELPKILSNDGKESEYKTAGFGGQINFRGYNYVVDFGGIPLEKIPLLYYLDFDKIDLLSLAQELCDIISHELYVTLLPVIDHPVCEYLYKNNEQLVKEGRGNEIVAGIIRLDAIDKTQQPAYGAIKSYLDNLERRGINIENQDVGFELSNVTTDKFVAGGQEVDMYYFGSERDRDTLVKTEGLTDSVGDLNVKQWDIRCQLQQQILPYYGLLGEKAVTIPKGFGSYQQILLDSRNLNAFGVGNYYVATEMELRAALVDYKSWKKFLLSYNDTYIEDIAEHSALISSLSAQDSQINEVVSEFKEAVNIAGLEDSDLIEQYLEKIKTKSFAVTVPRCVWNTDQQLVPMDPTTGLPSSPCSPPYGYPLYYQRARSIGIIEAGIGKLIDAKTKLVKSTVEIKSQFENRDAPLADIATPDSYSAHINRLEKRLKEKIKEAGDNVAQFKASRGYKNLVSSIEEAKRNSSNWKTLQNNLGANSNRIAELTKIIGKDGADGTMSRFLYNINNEGQRHEENAKKVYEFVKKIAEECLGKKFLVRLPKSCNMNFSDTVTTFEFAFAANNFKTGPFGFKPRPLSTDPNYEQSSEWLLQLDIYKLSNPAEFSDLFHPYLVDNVDPTSFDGPKIKIADRFSEGAMKGNFNPFTENWEWNYKPEPQGGFFTYGQFGRNTSSVDFIYDNWNTLPLSIQQGLCPVDTKNLLSESKRIQAYAKYNNSHLLDFAGISTSDMTQQTIGNGGQFTPDVVESLPNNQDKKPDLSFSSLENFQKAQRLKQAQQDSMAFVKISIDEKLYLPPKVISRNTLIHGDKYLLDLVIPEPETRETIGSDGCTKETVVSYPYVTPQFSLPADGGANDRWASVADFDRRSSDSIMLSDEVVTDLEKLDDEHVYALITVPGRIKSTADIRWADGPLQAYKAVEKKHLMLQDVVNIPDFNIPNLPVKKPERDKLLCGEAPVFAPTDDTPLALAVAVSEAWNEAEKYGLLDTHWRPDEFDLKMNRENGIPLPPDGFRPGLREDWIKVTLEQVTSAREMTKKINRSLRLSTPESSLGYTSPSPIFPDMVALPLMSMERCYGPWLSATQLDPAQDARIKYSNIGGKVEFIKKEELTPWNYAGYQLLDEAGSLEANFSNSLLLFSERGGFVIPDAPTGIALATALQKGGPIITNIGISVGTGGVKTTVKMDLYTSQFGKLAKQKEMAISQITRERQKLTDTQNAASRRGLGKRSTSADLVNGVMQAGGRQLLDEVNANNALQESNKEFAKEIDDQVLIVGKDGATSMGSKDALRKLAQMGTAESRAALQNDVIIQNGSQWSPYSNLPSNQLPMSENPNNRAMDRRTDANQNPGREQ